MIPDWLSLEPIDPVWIALALALGLVARRLGVPALVGFLASGFLLNAIGAVPGPFLLEAADLGVTLLLFTIGLHLSLRLFARPEVWAVGVVHMALAVGLLTLLVLALSAWGVGPLAGMGAGAAATLGLALAFSSTVFTVKALEDRGAQGTRHGRIAVGVLIIQDLVAVVYLAFGTGARPEPWALALLALPLLRRPLQRVLDRAGHGELLVLFGVACAMGGAAVFEMAGLKADLGALAVGLLLAGSAKADELSQSMDALKDVFLVGFFVTVGLTVSVDLAAMLLGSAFVLLLPLKASGFLVLFTRARLRARTAWQASLDLTTYSEFGLIVVAAAVGAGVLPDATLAVMAVAVGLSLAVAAPVAARGDRLYDRWRVPLRRLQTSQRLPGDEDLNLRPVEAVVMGVGRIGSAALTTAERRYPGRVLGVDVSPRLVARHQAAGHHVIQGDATDPEFWSRTEDLLTHLDWVLLTMATHEANVAAAQRLRARGYRGRMAATSRYPDQAQELRDLGVDVVFDLFTEAGAGFAADLETRLGGAPEPPSVG